MKSSTVTDCRIIDLPRIYRTSGNITAVNNNSEVPFEVRRVYYLYDVPGGESRGGHAHRELQQMIVAVSGSFVITITDGVSKRDIMLSRPYKGLYLPPGLWRELHDFSSGAICLVLASKPYGEEDYIRNYVSFVNYKGHPHAPGY